MINPVEWLDGFVTRRVFQPLIDKYQVQPIVAASVALEVELASSLALLIITRPFGLGALYALIALFSAGWLLGRHRMSNWRPVSRLLAVFSGCLGILFAAVVTLVAPGFGLTLLALAVSGASAPYFAKCVVPAVGHSKVS